MMIGKIENLSNEDYHAGEGISSSQLKDFHNKPPAFYKAKYLDKVLPQKSSSAFAMGSAVHTSFLEPAKVMDEIAVLPDWNLRTAAGKASKKQFEDENVGRAILKPQEWEKVEAMTNALNSVEAIANTRNGSTFEDSIFWEDEETGLLLKIRPDILNPAFCGDLKTAQSASERGFGYAIRKFGYHFSAAMYLDGLKSIGIDTDTFVWPVVENEPPYLTAIYVMSPEMLAEGYQMYREAVVNLAEAMKTGNWPGYNNGEITLIGEPKDEQ